MRCINIWRDRRIESSCFWRGELAKEPLFYYEPFLVLSYLWSYEHILLWWKRLENKELTESIITESGVLPVKTKFSCLAALTNAPSSVLGKWMKANTWWKKKYPQNKRNMLLWYNFLFNFKRSKILCMLAPAIKIHFFFYWIWQCQGNE